MALAVGLIFFMSISVASCLGGLFFHVPFFLLFYLLGEGKGRAWASYDFLAVCLICSVSLSVFVSLVVWGFVLPCILFLPRGGRKGDYFTSAVFRVFMNSYQEAFWLMWIYKK